jgi:dihydroflavonol-4-reductase
MVLVTGGTGLVGSHLLLQLIKLQKKVRALKRPNGNIDDVRKIFSLYSDTPEKLFNEIEWIEGDVLDMFSLEEAIKGVEYVYHCAATISFDPADFENMIKINEAGTANVVNASLKGGIKKLCHVSSIATLGKPENQKLSDEETYWKYSPYNSVYAISKYNAEREVWRAASEGLNVVIVNPGIILGATNWNKSSGVMFKNAFEGMKFFGEGMAGFVDVRDVCRAMIELMDKENIINQRYVLISENVSYRQFFNMIADEFGKTRPYIKANNFLAEFVWIIESLRSKIRRKPPIITRETARAANNIDRYSNSKVKEALNFEFIPVKKSVEDICKIYLSENK